MKFRAHSRRDPPQTLPKENLFNVLRGYTNIEGAEVLDLFAGTGSITAEFLSRECASVTSVELDREHYAFIGAVVKKLGAENCRLLRGDALRFIKRATKKFDIVLQTLPTNSKSLPGFRKWSWRRGYSNPTGSLILEHGKTNDFAAHPWFFDHRSYGSVNFSFFSEELSKKKNNED